MEMYLFRITIESLSWGSYYIILQIKFAFLKNTYHYPNLFTIYQTLGFQHLNGGGKYYAVRCAMFFKRIQKIEEKKSW